MKFRKDVYGYYDSPLQETPVHDPGIDNGVCPLCGKPLLRPLITTSFMVPGNERSFFYRVHKECNDKATAEEITAIESIVIDNL